MKTEYFPQNHVPEAVTKEPVYILPEEGTLYKVSLHAHSTCAGGSPLLPAAFDDCHRMWEDHTPQAKGLFKKEGHAAWSMPYYF